jgi:peroxiredoxin Q/BCP
MKSQSLKEGDRAPEFNLPDESENYRKLADFRGKWVVLYFYPRDDTPGCTIEAINFTKDLKKFKKFNSVVLGVSPDSGKSHCRFIKKHRLKLALLSDPDHKILEKYGAWKQKNLYGKKTMGVERSTFLINPEGSIQGIWRKVRVFGHTLEVLEALKNVARN